jgi:hypothetical protein
MRMIWMLLAAVAADTPRPPISAHLDDVLTICRQAHNVSHRLGGDGAAATDIVMNEAGMKFGRDDATIWFALTVCSSYEAGVTDVRTGKASPDNVVRK